MNIYIDRLKSICWKETILQFKRYVKSGESIYWKHLLIIWSKKCFDQMILLLVPFYILNYKHDLFCIEHYYFSCNTFLLMLISSFMRCFRWWFVFDSLISMQIKHVSPKNIYYSSVQIIKVIKYFFLFNIQSRYFVYDGFPLKYNLRKQPF